jgi:hypothetical protein
MSKKLPKYPMIKKLLPLLESLQIPEDPCDLVDFCGILNYDCDAVCAECPIFDEDNFDLLLKEIEEITETVKSNPTNQQPVACNCVHGKYGHCSVKVISNKFPCDKSCPAYKMPKIAEAKK